MLSCKIERSPVLTFVWGSIRSFSRDVRKRIKGYNLNLILIDPVSDDLMRDKNDFLSVDIILVVPDFEFMIHVLRKRFFICKGDDSDDNGEIIPVKKMKNKNSSTKTPEVCTVLSDAEEDATQWLDFLR